ncbi:hypothetical protein BDD12DRAFT_833427 [Trichophaea hybrida]|nr:hypothetical protein BDD12DRAFT_833427 [Trichophaea hybrida]
MSVFDTVLQHDQITVAAVVIRSILTLLLLSFLSELCTLHDTHNTIFLNLMRCVNGQTQVMDAYNHSSWDQYNQTGLPNGS